MESFQIPKRWLFKIFVCALVFIPSTGEVMELETLEARMALGDVAKVLSTFFPKIEGKVFSREGDQVIVDIKDAGQAASGVLFSVIRIGAPFYNPLSREIMGYSEEELGTIQLIDSREHSLTAKVVTEHRTIGIGDIVRLSGGRIPLLVEFEDKVMEGLGSEFKSALEETGRFTVFEHSDSNSASYVLKISSHLKDTEIEMGIQLHVLPLYYKISKFNILVSLPKKE